MKLVPLIRQHRAQLPLLYLSILTASYAAMILATPRPLLQDYPTWVYEGVAISHALEGRPDAQFAFKHFPVPNLFSDVGLGLLCSVMNWQWAAKLWLCFYLALSVFTCLHFAGRLGRGPIYVYWMAPTIGIVNLCFWWGFLNFQFSVLFLLLFCSVLLRQRPRPFTVASLLVLVFLSHAISFVVCGLALLIHVAERKSYRLLLAAVPSISLAAWYLYGRFVSTGNPEGSILKDAPVPYLSKAFALYKVNTYLKSLGYVNPTLHQAALGGVLLGSIGMCILIAIAMILGISMIYLFAENARACMRARGPERLLWLTCSVAVVVAVCCPSRSFGLSDPGARFMVCALTLGVMLLRSGGKIMWLSCFLSVMLGVAGAAMFYQLSFRGADGHASLPHFVTEFAHVAPDSRAYYYDALQAGKMTDKVFGTALLLNKQAAPSEPFRSKLAPDRFANFRPF